MNEIHRLRGVLAEAQTYLTAAEWRLGAMAMNRPVPARFYNDLTFVKRQNAELAQGMAQALVSQTEQLGAIFTILVGGAAVGLTALTGWILKNRQDAKALEAKTALYEQLEQDIGPQKAAQLVLGSSAGIGEILDKILLIGLLGAGAFIFVKVLK